MGRILTSGRIFRQDEKLRTEKSGRRASGHAGRDISFALQLANAALSLSEQAIEHPITQAATKGIDGAINEGTRNDQRDVFSFQPDAPKTAPSGEPAVSLQHPGKIVPQLEDEVQVPVSLAQQLELTPKLELELGGEEGQRVLGFDATQAEMHMFTPEDIGTATTRESLRKKTPEPKAPSLMTARVPLNSMSDIERAIPENFLNEGFVASAAGAIATGALSDHAHAFGQSSDARVARDLERFHSRIRQLRADHEARASRRSRQAAQDARQKAQDAKDAMSDARHASRLAFDKQKHADIMAWRKRRKKSKGHKGGGIGRRAQKDLMRHINRAETHMRQEIKSSESSLESAKSQALSRETYITRRKRMQEVVSSKAKEVRSASQDMRKTKDLLDTHLKNKPALPSERKTWESKTSRLRKELSTAKGKVAKLRTSEAAERSKMSKFDAAQKKAQGTVKRRSGMTTAETKKALKRIRALKEKVLRKTITKSERSQLIKLISRVGN